MQTMLRMVGFGDNAGSGFPTILNTWKNEGWVKPELIEDSNLNRVTLVMKMEDRENENVIENENFAQKNERSLSEVLSKKDIEKVLPILAILEKKGVITPKEAVDACDRSPATVRRYLGALVDLGVIVVEGSTNKTVYKVIRK